ncbi:MAG TPA: anthranilate synthase component I [Actinomycetes bacterium]|nr:anthranilate synthase component I [Actinomycetes bacterium]
MTVGGPRPDLEEFARLAAGHSVVPVWRELLGDLETPVGAFRKLGGAEGSVLLESVEHGERWGRYSFIGTDPFATLTIARGRATWTGSPPAGLPDGPPVQVLRAALQRLRSPSLPGLPPLFAGAVGYLGYDLVRELERLPDQTEDDLGLPDGVLVLPRSVVVFDHLGQRLVLVANVLVDGGTDPRAAYAEAAARLDALADRLAVASPAPPVPLPAAGPPAAATSDLPPGRYQEMVRAAKRHIRAGDVFQVVPSQRFSVRTDADPFDVYRVLRVVNPSPYMYFLRLPGVVLAGSSPEVLVTVQGRTATMRPIAGTRPRGADVQHDQALEAELLADEKERAEHVMLVDLARNDLGRVSRPGTVRVADFMRVERYSHVMHLVSDVVGELDEGVAALDVLAASFPAGTVSGAPKVRAMELIDELERHRRGPYAGCVGYFDFSGNLDTCITIRTCVFVDGVAHCQAGAGVVADSVPEREERETEAKARALLAAVAAAEALPGAARAEGSGEPRRGAPENRPAAFRSGG